jgi:hypothetical protein
VAISIHLRDSSRDSLSESIGFRQSFRTRAEKSYQSPKDSGRASALELRGWLPIVREALRPSEPRHSIDKATPSYYTKKKSFASGISKMWCVCVDFHRSGVFMGPCGSSTDLVEAVTCHVAAGRPMSLASTDFIHRHSLPLLM